MITIAEKRCFEAVGRNLKRIRKSRHLSQVQLYVKSGVSQSVISDYESGNRNPSLLSLYRLSQALSCSVAEFWIVEGTWNVYETADTEEEQPIAWECSRCGEVVECKYKFCPECGSRNERVNC